MSLSGYQQGFTHKIALLILFAEEIGYKLTFGDAYRDDRCAYGHPDSNHKRRLAVDFNIFEDGVYLIDEEGEDAHHKLHDFWDELDGAERIENDLNHYSLEWQGMR